MDDKRLIPNDQPLREQTINRMLNHLMNILRVDGVLTKWEEEFIQSIYIQFEKKGNLSNKQCEILERIYDNA